ncbi:Gfo/Idh/MocA family protein [Rubellimicrobium sp. CFH 75288]|uniref:Gfo/Idh/MocA family protein n=1 Tax=Rubellimicrobium sp. CFH 75288 TaxID=2697034 RepID=UPI0014131BBD|nr:Gfo/Idh/MocA family oxidoreductase [Rubellimicrobium sp. CFH 75288]NAZ36232.1 Gfo/Idh/MocA family oxidoreductase [Rubellimicrobium sp. CFH 75288]
MRWGLIGASTIAAEHMIAAIRSEGGEIACVQGGDADRIGAYAGRHGIPRAETDLDALLKGGEVQAVYISSTNEKHRAQALAAVAAGCHVLCEKPLALTVAEAREMVGAAEAAGLVFATNHHLRNAATHLALRDAVKAGRVGRVLSVRVFHAVHLPPHLQGWRIDDPAAGGGVIPDITVHDADTVRHILDETPETVVAMAGESGMGRGVEDSVMSVWSMPSGAMVMAHESFTHRFAETGVEVHGTDGSLYGRGIMTQRPLGTVELVTAEGRETLPAPPHDLYARGVRLFHEAVAGRGRPAADGRDGIASLAVALAVREAARTGRRVAVEV